MSKDNRTAEEILRSLADQWKVTYCQHLDKGGGEVDLVIGTPPETGEHTGKMGFECKAEGLKINVSAVTTKAALGVG